LKIAPFVRKSTEASARSAGEWREKINKVKNFEILIITTTISRL
jgi:hypothetical protein